MRGSLRLGLAPPLPRTPPSAYWRTGWSFGRLQLLVACLPASSSPPCTFCCSGWCLGPLQLPAVSMPPVGWPCAVPPAARMRIQRLLPLLSGGPSAHETCIHRRRCLRSCLQKNNVISGEHCNIGASFVVSLVRGSPVCFPSQRGIHDKYVSTQKCFQGNCPVAVILL